MSGEAKTIRVKMVSKGDESRLHADKKKKIMIHVMPQSIPA